jgi:hypothetical protein
MFQTNVGIVYRFATNINIGIEDQTKLVLLVNIHDLKQHLPNREVEKIGRYQNNLV